MRCHTASKIKTQLEILVMKINSTSVWSNDGSNFSLTIRKRIWLIFFLLVFIDVHFFLRRFLPFQLRFLKYNDMAFKIETTQLNIITARYSMIDATVQEFNPCNNRILPNINLYICVVLIAQLYLFFQNTSFL